MKFSPFIVTAFAIFSLGLAGCQPQKSAKDAAKDGKKTVAQVSALNVDLADNHGVLCYSTKVTDAQIQADANHKDWSTLNRVAIRQKLNDIIAKIDRVFKIDRRKDVKLNDPNHALERTKNNALAYLKSLDSYEKSLANNKPVPQDPQQPKTDDSGNYGWGGRGNLPTLQ